MKSAQTKHIKQMGVLLLMALLALAAAGCSGRPASSSDKAAFAAQIIAAYPELKSKPYTVERVKRVVDGDTFETESGQKVRLIGMNTPESIGQVEYFGKEASEYSKRQLTNQTVFLFSDTGDTDKYGRWLRYVFLDGKTLMYNEKLVLEGYANPMTVPPNVMYADRFVKAEREARKAEKGLWKQEGAAGSSKPDAKAAPTQNPEGTKSGACSNPAIKGNVNSKKEKIYHVPGGRFYEQTTAEELFCTEREAEAAGYRASKE